jgi:hydroxyacid-oxoacid transhydrogenase
MEHEIAFEVGATNLRFGFGITREVGMDLADMGVKNVMVVTDPYVSKSEPVGVLLESLEREKLRYSLFDKAHVEPTDTSFNEAIKFAREGDFDGFVGIGGGTSIDTAKVSSLYSTHPADLLDYVNAPIGKGKPVPGPLKPIIAIPTTSGSGSETTGVIIFDLVEMHSKTGIAHGYIKPTMAVIDPENTRTLPPEVAASTAMDVLVGAVEAYTAIHYTERPRPERPGLRPPYQGINYISDVWAVQAMKMVAENLPRVFDDSSDDEARAQMLLAAAYTGTGFAYSGVHLPHGMSYPVSGLVKDFIPPGYPVDYPLIPHGISVVLNAPAVFRFTGSACPDRHLKAAEIIGADISRAKEADAGKILADQIIRIMKRVKIPNGLSAVGYTREDIPALVKGTLPQHRVIKLSPRPVGKEELAALFEDAMAYW